MRVAVLVAGLGALAGYLLPGLRAAGTHWPLWDVTVYRWGGQQAAAGGGALYVPGARFSFTYPPFAAAVFAPAAGAPLSVLRVVLTAANVCALVALCWLALGAARVARRPEIVFAVTALALLMVPVSDTLHLGQVDLIVAALAGADLLRRRDGGWWQGIGTGLAAGIKLTPLIFVAYLAVTGRLRAAATAAATFAATVAAGAVLLPGKSQLFWLGGVFAQANRIGNPANPGNQALSGMVARLAGNLGASHSWWLAAELLTGAAGIAIAAWAHRRGHRMAGVACCGITGLLISPISWLHHWVWAVPLLIGLGAGAWRRLSPPWYALATVAAVAVFSGLVPIPGRGSNPTIWRLLQGDLYILCGLALLAAAALALTRERAVVQPVSARSPSPPRL